MALTFRQYMWLFQHMSGLSHTYVVKSTYYTGSSCVVFTTQVCLIAHMCGNNQTCVENPHRQVLGYFHTCLVKHTHRLISPWANGAVPCESLVSREFSRIFFQFHFSISISGHFHFTFHSRSRFQGIFISLFTLGKSESISNFTLFSREKRVKYAFLVNEGQCEADERIWGSTVLPPLHCNTL